MRVSYIQFDASAMHGDVTESQMWAKLIKNMAPPTTVAHAHERAVKVRRAGACAAQSEPIVILNAAVKADARMIITL